MGSNISVGIVGATGYTGLELVKILLKHPYFDLVYIANSEGNTTINKLHPSLNGICESQVHKADIETMA